MDKIEMPERYTVAPHDTAFADIFANAAEHPDHVAASRGGPRRWTPVTCRELAAEVETVAAGLVTAGINPGDRVAVMSRTRYEWLLVDFAVLSIGAITVPIYETSSNEQVEWILADSGAVAAFVEDGRRADRVRALADGLPALRSVWAMNDDLVRLAQDGLQVGAEVVAERRAAVSADDLATVVYTSGTTGRPKGCMLTHANLVALVRNVTAADGFHALVFNEEQSTLLFLPLAHVLARVIAASALHARVHLALLPDPADAPAALRSFRPTVVLTVPRVLEKVYGSARQRAGHGLASAVFAAGDATAVAFSAALDRPRGPGWGLRLRHRLYDLLVYRRVRAAMGGRVRWAVSGGAPLGAKLGHFFRGAGITVLEGWGLTETTAGGTLNLPDHLEIGSVGRPIPGCTVRVADDGELLVRGAHVFSGYWHEGAATAEVLDSEGWLHTGDVGRIDDDGYVFITDRKKDLIVTASGKNVAPAVLEDRLRAHPLVSQAAVFGDRRPYISALLTLDTDALDGWKRDRHKPATAPVQRMIRDPELLAELQAAVDAANTAVSHPEAIKRWAVLPTDFTERTGELTPTFKLRRDTIASQFARDVDALYS